MKEEMVENRISENLFGVFVKPRESGCCGGDGQGMSGDLASLAARFIRESGDRDRGTYLAFSYADPDVRW